MPCDEATDETCFLLQITCGIDPARLDNAKVDLETNCMKSRAQNSRSDFPRGFY